MDENDNNDFFILEAETIEDYINKGQIIEINPLMAEYHGGEAEEAIAIEDIQQSLNLE